MARVMISFDVEPPPWDLGLVRAFLSAADQYWGQLGISARDEYSPVNGEAAAVPIILIETAREEIRIGRLSGAVALWSHVIGAVDEVVGVTAEGAGEITLELFKRFLAGPLPMADIEAAAAHAKFLRERHGY